MDDYIYEEVKSKIEELIQYTQQQADQAFYTTSASYLDGMVKGLKKALDILGEKRLSK